MYWYVFMCVTQVSGLNLYFTLVWCSVVHETKIPRPRPRPWGPRPRPRPRGSRPRPHGPRPRPRPRGPRPRPRPRPHHPGDQDQDLSLKTMNAILSCSVTHSHYSDQMLIIFIVVVFVPKSSRSHE